MKLNASQLSVLKAIQAAKKATKKVALTGGGNAVTIGKLLDAGLVETNEPTKKVKEHTYSLTANGKAELKVLAKAEAKAAKLDTVPA